MTRLLIVLISLCIVNEAFALDLKVKKIKGRKAIVEFSEPYAASPGDLLTVQEGRNPNSSYSETIVMSDGSMPKYAVTGGFDLSSMSYDAGGGDVDVSNTSIYVRFGWVYPEFEAGPIFFINNQEYDFGGFNISIDTFFLGGYGEYNLAKPGEKLIPAVGGIIGYTTQDLASDVNGFRFEPYIRGKYFVQGTSGFVVIGQLGYRIDELSGNGVDASGSGFVMSVGMAYYF